MSDLSTHPGFQRMYDSDELTFGAIFPLESYEGTTPSMDRQVELAQKAEELGFDALWFRDVPLLDPEFGDAGQLYDPWVYLSHIAAHTDDISLATGAIILPLRHPLHVAKAAASVNNLSDGRLVLGVASGDRPIEYQAFDKDLDARGERFRESVTMLRRLWGEEFPEIDSSFGTMDGDVNLIPKPTTGQIPLIITGHARQEEEWIAKHGDGWMYYTQPFDEQDDTIEQWRELTANHTEKQFKPFGQSMYVDLAADPSESPSHIHQGFRTGREWLIKYISELDDIGVNHLMFNLKYNERPAGEVMEELATEVFPEVPVQASPQNPATDT